MGRGPQRHTVCVFTAKYNQFSPIIGFLDQNFMVRRSVTLLVGGCAGGASAALQGLHYKDLGIKSLNLLLKTT